MTPVFCRYCGSLTGAILAENKPPPEVCHICSTTFAAGYRAGQERMRERAAKVAKIASYEWDIARAAPDYIAATIAALSIEPPPDASWY